MTRWRVGLAALLTLLIVVPLSPPWLRLGEPAVWRWSADDLERVALLAVNTLLLVGGTCLLGLLLGVPLALLLFRTPLHACRSYRVVLLLLLFVPLPTIVSSWQALLGPEGIWPAHWWRASVDRPWTTGLGPAIWIHALAALPWVAWIVGLSLRQVEPELEEQALLTASPWRVLWRVTLPRCGPGIVAAVAFVGIATANEITVTDMLLVPTLAEEVHTQFTLGHGDALPRLLVLSLPFLALVGVGLGFASRCVPSLPAAGDLRATTVLVRPRWGAWLALGFFALALLPLLGLVWKIGLAGQPRRWSFEQAVTVLHAEAWLYGVPIVENLGVALATAGLTVSLALLIAWLTAESRAWRGSAMALLLFTWVLPGPVLGIALHDSILFLATLPHGPWTVALYEGPSPLPVMWVQTIRFLPAAVFFLGPVVARLPRGLRETARSVGAGPGRELWHLVVPATRRALGVTVLAVTALCLGEVGASTRVETPGWETFAKLLFDRMHYGVEANVAALALLLLAAVAVPIALGAWLRR